MKFSVGNCFVPYGYNAPFPSKGKFSFVIYFYFIFFSNDVSKEERPELVKKVYKWNTKEEAKQAFKELLKEKVIFFFFCSLSPL